MANHFENPYRGYHITTHSSGGTSPPYCASFDVTEVLPNGEMGSTEHHECDGTYQSEDDAHAAANVAARHYIDASVSSR